MICTEFYNGQGLGNQLWLYVVTRVKAADLGCDFGILGPEKFKGVTFMQIDFGESIRGGGGPEGGPPYELPDGITNYYYEPQSSYLKTRQTSTDYDPSFFEITQNTKIDGNLQNEDYIRHRKDEIRLWLSYDEKQIRDQIKARLTDDTCVINFRGGEYRHMNKVLLPKSYWNNAKRKMLDFNNKMKFIVVTDDIELARIYFDKDEVIDCSLAEDYYLINNAQFLIISNSSFAWFPAWLNLNVRRCIAPKYWWGFNQNLMWSPSYSLTRGWYYLDRLGNLSEYLTCVEEKRVNNNKIESRTIEKSKFLLMRIARLLPDNSPRFLIKFFLTRRRKSRSSVYFTILINKLFRKNVRDFNDAFIRKVTRAKYTTKEFPLFTIVKGSTWIESERQNRLVIDSFYFFNEIELLSARLDFLDKYVDYFLIAESRQTFTGETKPLFFNENRELFSKFEHKIIHFEIPAAPQKRAELYSLIYDTRVDPKIKTIASRALTDSNVPGGESNWITEYFQKESLIIPLSDLPVDSIVFISDLDEFWNPKSRFRITNSNVLIFKQNPYIYFMNCESDESWRNWTGTCLAESATLLESGINAARTHNRLNRRVIRDGGWHFSYQGGRARLLEKLKANTHQEFNTNSNRANLEVYISELRDLRDVNANLRKNDSRLPPFAAQFREKHPDWFLN